MSDLVETPMSIDTKNARSKSGWRVRWCLVAFFALAALVACSGDGGLLTPGQAGRGEALVVVLEDMRRVPEVRYLGRDAAHYRVAPSSDDQELLVVRLTVYNEGSTTVLMNLNEEAAELRGFGLDEKYRPLDVTPTNTTNVRKVEDTHSSEGRYMPFLSGIIGTNDSPGLPLNHALEGWMVFEVPTGTRIREFKWEAGDSIFLRG